MSETRLSTWENRDGRVIALDWNRDTLKSGCHYSRIIHYDVRAQSATPYTISNGHTYEVCGLKWSPDGQQLASGSDDNLAHTRDASRLSKTILRLDLYRSAVKAISWCPHQSDILATGGWDGDGMLRFWDTCGNTGVGTKAVDTKSPVSGIA